MTPRGGLRSRRGRRRRPGRNGGRRPVSGLVGGDLLTIALPRVDFYDQNTQTHRSGMLINWYGGQPIAVVDGKALLLPDNDLVLIDGQRLSEWKRANWSHPYRGT